MDLREAAAWFDTNPIQDAYTGVLLGAGQLDLYDGTERDSETAQRRILSVTPEQHLLTPLRRAIEMAGTRYILGRPNTDMFEGTAIRVGYVAQEAQGQAHIRTIGQVLRAETGTQAWAALAWIKDKAFTEQGSDLAPEFHMFLANTETLAVNQVIEYGAKLYIVRSLHESTADFLTPLVEEIAAPGVESVALSAGYDPVSGTHDATTSTVLALHLRWQSLFRYNSPAAKDFGPDDAQFVVAQAHATPAVGQTMTSLGRRWRVKSVEAFEDCWLCRVNRHD